MKLVLNILFSLIVGVAHAQVEAIPERTLYDTEVLNLMEQAQIEMNAENYVAANKTFRKALASKKILPTNLSYLFAETLFMIQQYQNSRNFVTKYIDLAGKGGDYYEEAINLQGLVDAQFNTIKECTYCNLTGYRYELCQHCDATGVTTEECYHCKGNGLTTCPKCTGQGVVIIFNSFNGRQYHSCDKCDSKGYIVCPICNGEKTISGICSVCLGTSKRVSSILCNHEEHQQ